MTGNPRSENRAYGVPAAVPLSAYGDVVPDKWNHPPSQPLRQWLKWGAQGAQPPAPI